MPFLQAFRRLTTSGRRTRTNQWTRQNIVVHRMQEGYLALEGHPQLITLRALNDCSAKLSNHIKCPHQSPQLLSYIAKLAWHRWLRHVDCSLLDLDQWVHQARLPENSDFHFLWEVKQEIHDLVREMFHFQVVWKNEVWLVGLVDFGKFLHWVQYLLHILRIQLAWLELFGVSSTVGNSGTQICDDPWTELHSRSDAGRMLSGAHLNSLSAWDNQTADGLS